MSGDSAYGTAEVKSRDGADRRATPRLDGPESARMTPLATVATGAVARRAGAV
jgi:hypothetical protein